MPEKMNKVEPIVLACKFCEDTHKYVYSDSKFNAIEVDWISSDNNFHLLYTSPKIGASHSVSLRAPLTIKKDVPFWAVYLNPESTLNGIANEQDLTDIRFCLCKISELIELNKVSALVQVEVVDIKKIDSLSTNSESYVEWRALIDEGDSFKKYGSVENYNWYSYISVNIESDLGLDVIIKKEHYTSYIAAINQWNFHLNEWILCRVPLSQEDEKKYGIQHFV